MSEYFFPSNSYILAANYRFYRYEFNCCPFWRQIYFFPAIVHLLPQMRLLFNLTVWKSLRVQSSHLRILSVPVYQLTSFMQLPINSILRIHIWYKARPLGYGAGPICAYLLGVGWPLQAPQFWHTIGTISSNKPAFCLTRATWCITMKWVSSVG